MAAMETVTQPEPMKGLQVLIPASIHEVLRVESARRELSMGALVAESVAAHLQKPNEKAA